MYITWQTIIQAGAVITALVTIVSIIWKLLNWFLTQKTKQVNNSEALLDVQDLHNKDIQDLQTELYVMHEAMFAILDGLTQLHCNGAVTKAYKKLESHLNKQAHNQT